MKTPTPPTTAAHLAHLRDRLSTYARPADADPGGPARRLAPYVQRCHRLNRLIKTLDARRLPTDLHAAIDEALQTMEEEGFFDAFDNPPSSQPDPENRGVDL